MENFKPHKKIIRMAFFWAGVIATFAYRIIIVLTGLDPIWVKVSWYIGTIGFIIYFIHRFQISEKRTDLIVKYRLSEKIDEVQGLNPEERAAMGYVVRTLVSSWEKWNYIFIFITSGLALIWGILIDFILK